MRTGQLNSRVTIKQLVAGQDALGQPVQTWSVLASVWANIKFLSGAQAVRSGAETSISKVAIRIRYRADVNAGMRVEDGAMVYDIRAVLPDVANRGFTDFVCEVIA